MMVGWRGRACLWAAAAASMMVAAIPASAQLFFRSPDFRGQPVSGGEPGITLPLPGATKAELDASIVWTLRAGLNFAALQCQFAPSLMTRVNYNGVIAHHAKELNADYQKLGAYFKRTAKKGTSANEIASAFDRFNTRTYNSFSTVDAQRGFCQTAASIGDAALMAPKGTLVSIARARLMEMRNSLKPMDDMINARRDYAFAGAEVPAYAPECFDKKGQVKKSCL